MRIETPTTKQSPGALLRTRKSPPFVGRVGDLAWLERCAAEAMYGRPVVAHLVGEAGIGKTRLLRELQALAETRGMQTAWGHGYEGFSIPLFPFAEALTPALTEHRSALQTRLGSTAELLHEFIAGPSKVGGPTATERKGEDRMRLFLAISEAVVALAKLKPLMLAVDDLHWIDQASIDLLSHLICTVTDRAPHEKIPLFIVTTMRPLGAEHPNVGAIARCQREEICSVHELSGLTEEETGEFVVNSVTGSVSHQMTSAISDATGGNPLFLQEVIYQLDKQGDIEAWRTGVPESEMILDVRLPADVTSAVTSRVAGLSNSCRSLLQYAACLGDPFTEELICTVTERKRDVVHDLLQEAVEAPVIVRERNGIRFVHPLIRHVLYGTSTAHLRRAAHFRAATALEQCNTLALSDRRTVEIAHHLVAAGQAAEPARVLEQARLAGDRAFANGSWKDAARFYRAALTAAASLSDKSAVALAELHYLAAQSHFRDQDADPCIEQFDQAVALYQASDDAVGLGRALAGHARAHFTLSSVAYGTLIDPKPMLDLVVRVGEDNLAVCGPLWSELSQVYWTARDTDRAREMAERAVDAARTTADPVLGAEAYRALSLACSQGMAVPAAAEAIEAGLKLAQATGDEWLESHLQQRVAVPTFWLGNLERCDEAAEAATKLTESTHDWGDHSIMQGQLVCMNVVRARFAAVEEHAHRAMKMRNRSGYPWALPVALPALARARFLQGRIDEAGDAIDSMVTPGVVFDQPGEIFLGMAFVLKALLACSAEETRQQARRKYAARFAKHPVTVSREAMRDAFGLGTYCALAELSAVLQDPALAAAAAEPLELAASNSVRLSGGWACSIDRCLATARRMTGDHDSAAGHVDRAIEFSRDKELHAEHAVSLLEKATQLLDSDDNRDAAAACLHQAQELIDRLGLAGLGADLGSLQVRAVVHGAESTQMPGSVGRRSQANATSTARTARILQAKARGKSDAEIAHEFLISESTVARLSAQGMLLTGTATAVEAAARLADPGAGSKSHDRSQPVRGDSLRVVLFTDVVGSTNLLETMGDTLGRKVLAEHDGIVHRLLDEFGGTKVKHTGDGVVAWFVSVSAAASCAVQVQRSLAERNQKSSGPHIDVHIGMSAGEPVAEDGDIFGRTVNEASRICTRARRSQILAADVVRLLAQGKGIEFVDRGLAALKGFKGRVRLFEIPWKNQVEHQSATQKE